MKKHLVFVYGSLRRGSECGMTVRFPGAKFMADVRVKGALYDLGDYPGLRLSQPYSWVVGEVYEVDDQLLKQLDDFEASSNYRRKQFEIFLNGENNLCWTYEPDPEFHSLRRMIVSGDWIEYARASAD